MPVLGIGVGMQQLNVFAGGTLSPAPADRQPEGDAALRPDRRARTGTWC